MSQTYAVYKNTTHHTVSNIFSHKFLGFTWQLKKSDAEYTLLNLYIENSRSCIEAACLELFKSSASLKYDADRCINNIHITHKNKIKMKWM